MHEKWTVKNSLSMRRLASLREKEGRGGQAWPPRLADLLAQDEAFLSLLSGQAPDTAVPDSLKPLWQDASVVAVVTGDSTGGMLTTETLRQSARIQA